MKKNIKSTNHLFAALGFAIGIALISDDLWVVKLAADTAPPFISPIPDQTMLENTTSAPIVFSVGDLDTPSAALAVTTQSSNQGLVPAANIVIVGMEGNRFLTITPAPNQTGTAVITLTVTDGGGLSASASFVLTVTGNTTPTQLSLGNQVWRDLNSNGVRDVGEPGIASVSLVLFREDANGSFNFVISTMSDSTGQYRFSGLAPGG